MKVRIIDKYLAGHATEEEKQLVESWYDEFHATDRKLHEDDPQAMERSRQRSLDIIRAQVKETSERRILPWRLAVAAAAVIAVLGGLFFYLGSPADTALLADDVAPGGSHAILRLADGRDIVLEDVGDGVLLEESGIQILKTGEGQLVYNVLQTADAVGELKGYNTVMTPRGGRYRVVLPDGTNVWLNASSILRYPVQFSDSVREVELQGEGYFEVARIPKAENITSESDPAFLPFIVCAGDQRIEVLGTEFNINAYADEDGTRTTLVHGSVRVHRQNISDGDAILLQPGQTVISLKGPDSGLQVIPAAIESIVSWREGYFYFQEQHISSIMRELARWYDVEVVYDRGMTTDGLYFSGSVSSDKNLSQVLRVMEATGTVKFDISERRVTVMK